MDLKEIDFKISIIMSICLILCGGLLNIFAVAVNDGKMPVLTDNNFETDLHKSIKSCEEATRCIYADIFRISYIHFSIGDIFTFVGVLLIIYFYIQRFVKWLIFKRRFYKMKKDLEDRF